MPSYDQREKESGKAYDAFRRYLILGRERTYAEVARLSKKNPAQIRRWAKRWEWPKRYDEYDVQADKRLEQLKDMALREALGDARVAVTEMNRLQSAFANRLYGIVSMSLDKLSEEDAEPLTPLEIIRWLEVGTKIDRMAKEGLLESFHVEQSQAGDLITFNDVLKKVYQRKEDHHGRLEISDQTVDGDEPK
ncbi:MAG: hypothetical protein V3U60_16020 [Gammaproteobacteria bacterium]